MSSDISSDFIVLAGPYSIAEGHLLGAVIQDLINGGIRFKLVETPEGTEVWRDKRGWKDWGGPNRSRVEYKNPDHVCRGRIPHKSRGKE